MEEAPVCNANLSQQVDEQIFQSNQILWSNPLRDLMNVDFLLTRSELPGKLVKLFEAIIFSHRSALSEVVTN